MHTYSLIHDDLPAMDDDDLRRGRPTCHKAFDEATAILAGDGLLTLAFEVMARAGSRRPRRPLRCVRILAEAAGPGGMVGGQMADLQAEGEHRPGTRAREQLEAIHRRKTGALLRAPLRWGRHRRRRKRPPGRARSLRHGPSGLAFQIIDDLLDVQGDEAKLGKRVGKDSGLGKWTYPGLLGIEGSRREARQLADEAVAALAPLGDAGRRLRAWPWIFWKGIVDEQHDVAKDRVAGRPQDALRARSSSSSPREMRERADRRRRPPLGALRQQPRRGRALPGTSPDLRLLAQDRLIWDTGHQIYPHKLITGRADELAHDPDQGGPDGLPQPGREPVRPVHDRPCRLRTSTALGLKAGDDLVGPAAIGTRWP